MKLCCNVMYSFQRNFLTYSIRNTMKILSRLKCSNLLILGTLAILLIPIDGCSPEPEHTPRKVILREIGRIPAQDEGEGFYFAGIYDACKNSRYIYVADWKDHSIKIFNRDLEFVKQFGSKGTGPGEFSMIFSGLKCDDQYIYILTINRLYRFSAEGEFIGEINLPFLPADVFPKEDGYLFTQHDKLILRLTDLKGKTREVFYSGEKFEVAINNKLRSYYQAPSCFLLSRDRLLVPSLRSYNFSIFDFRKKKIEKTVERDVDFYAFHYAVGKDVPMGMQSRGGYSRLIPNGDRYFYFYTGADEKLRFDIYNSDFEMENSCVTDREIFPLLALSDHQFLFFDPRESDALLIIEWEYLSE